MCNHSKGSPSSRKWYIDQYRDERWTLVDVKYSEDEAMKIAKENCEKTGRDTRVLALRVVAEFKESIDG